MIKEKILEYSNSIYPLKNIYRYNNISRIKDESLIEHLGFVTLIVIELRKYYNFNLEKAMIMSITHDLPELYISDVPRNIKNKFPLLKEVLREAEEKAWEEHFGNELFELNKEFESRSTIEGKIVSLADSISVLQYSQNEINLGNKGYMKQVYDEVLLIFDEKLKDIEDYKING